MYLSGQMTIVSTLIADELGGGVLPETREVHLSLLDSLGTHRP